MCEEIFPTRKYILSDHIALRSWILVPYAYYIRGRRNARGLKADEYALLRRCDGFQEIEDSSLLRSLMQRGLCRPAEENETLSSWQREKICRNRYFPALNWMLTGKCNYNCRHCFNAIDNSRLQSEFSVEEAEQLILEAEKCGINAFTITGGEPMLHPHFLRILQSIYDHGMYVEELNTNGSFLTQDVLDAMKAMGCRPLMKISFDGVGFHDWLRKREGAEEDAIRAIRLCVRNGFRVKVQTNVHRLNTHSMLPTAKLMNDIGVSEMRIIRTTESPRWLQNAGDACLTLEEYFDSMTAFLQDYAQTDCDMAVDVWQFVYLKPQRRFFLPKAMEYSPNGYCGSYPVCKGNRGMIAVGANGNLYPCHQMSGYYEQHGWVLGNVKTDGLQTHLRTGDYLKCVCATMDELKAHNAKCASCPYFLYCRGGCRAIGLALTEDVFGSDRSKCMYFEGNYTEKLQKALPGYQCLTAVY